MASLTHAFRSFRALAQYHRFIAIISFIALTIPIKIILLSNHLVLIFMNIIENIKVTGKLKKHRIEYVDWLYFKSSIR